MCNSLKLNQHNIFDLIPGMTRHSEFRFMAGPDRFRNHQTVLFREKRKKIGPKIYHFFGRVPELKYSRSFEMVTKLHNRSKQSQVSLCLLSIIGQSSIIQRLSIDKDRYSLVSSH